MNMRVLGWVLAVLTGALVIVITSASPAMACGISYETGTDPNAGCSGAASVGGAAAVGGMAVLTVVGLAIWNFMRGAMSQADLTDFLATIAPIAVPLTPGDQVLPQGRATRSLRQIRALRDPAQRWRAGEQWEREVEQAAGEQHFPVPVNDDPDFPVSSTGGRFVDVPKRLPDGSLLAIEVKTYGKFRSVRLGSGERINQPVDVPLSAHIREQINKDVALRAQLPGFEPRWSFLGAGPSPELRAYLTRAGILFIELD